MSGRILRGRVLRKKQSKTCVVLVRRRKRDDLIGKIYSHKSSYQVHDPFDSSRVGQEVFIRESRPYSKTKRWILEADPILEGGSA